MTNVLTGPWDLFTTSPQELAAIGVVLGIGIALTVLIFWTDLRWSGED